MRRIFLILFTVLCTLAAQAQDKALLSGIEKANATVKSLEAHFVQTKTLKAKKTSVKSEGTIYLQGADKMAMVYQKPSTDNLKINGSQFFMQRGKKKSLFNTTKNKMMRSLSNTLLYCVHGKVQTLAAENKAKLTTAQTADGITVTLKTEKKSARGYSKIVLVYHPTTKLLTRMQMDEFNGNSTLYQISGIKKNASVNAKVFEIKK